jgi:hypothetical protein
MNLWIPLLTHGTYLSRPVCNNSSTMMTDGLVCDAMLWFQNASTRLIALCWLPECMLCTCNRPGERNESKVWCSAHTHKKVNGRRDRAAPRALPHAAIHIMHTQARHSFVVMYLRVVIKFVTRHSRAQRGLTRRPATTLCRIPQVGRVRDTHDTLSA